ncbi:unnamed protein product [Clonostachys chloroleuca]|uniref:Uncharacterized protein n=1 Tax=Clonostachys chloroleuca TaxID=1926264 RepID=A0AA35Q9V2_9HYPO|nr:unnamed protein product [Clonostachys chloroleuca]
MRLSLASLSLALLTALGLLVAAAPVGTSTNVDLFRRGQIPADIGTTACKYYSDVPFVWTYEARIREPFMTVDGLCPKLEEKGKAVNLNCGLLIVKECKHDINDPQVKKWKFEVRAQCTGAMVAKAIKAATGQKSVSCDIVYDKNKWP